MYSSEKTPEAQNSFSFFGLCGCSSESLLGRFLQRCLDTSIAGKLIGMLVVSLAGFAVLIILNTVSLQKIAGSDHVIRDIAIPRYKITQYILRSINGFKISLLHVLDSPQIKDNDLNVAANRQRLADMGRMIRALRDGGTVQDVAKVAGRTLDVITVAPAVDPRVKDLIADISREYQLVDETYESLITSLVGKGTPQEKNERLDDLLSSLDEMYELVIVMTAEINKQQGEQFKQLENIIGNSMSRSIWIGVAIAAVLTVATLLYILVIVVPLRSILEKIRFIAKGEGERAQHIDVRSNDEVGQLAHQLNTMVDNIFSLNSFKAIIEEEESTTEVNQRLAALLNERYHLASIFIYELTGNKNKMSVAFASDLGEVCSPQILEDSNFCRAKRTGHPISSLEFPDICKQFPHKGRMEHHCIPMIANGRVVGVVQFLCPMESDPEERSRFEKTVKRASRYIKEATPVIEAKRFASALHETTMRDPMTDLYNRRFLESYTDTLVASTLRRKTKVGILMCDMDFFKEVNDTYGHETGDVVLIKTAEVLKNCVRASDMVIRYGGEEFIVLLIDVKNKEDVLELAERIRKTMEATVINVPDGTLKKTLSIGASEFPGDTNGFWEAIKYADVALYRAKEEGRNRVVSFTPEMWKEDKY
ncbi:MAG: diguanylate cyclase [Deltaproteobacteria bacterium]|nr:diguanylate cyclase [Deltaproteobacteria bacterium]